MDSYILELVNRFWMIPHGNKKENILDTAVCPSKQMVPSEVERIT
jgi:hypothetical protein